jgi:hypothetical protein
MERRDDHAWAVSTSELPVLWSTTRRWWRELERDADLAPLKPLDRHMLRDLSATGFQLTDATAFDTTHDG